MNSRQQWQQFLTQQGATVSNDLVQHFEDPAAEIAAAANLANIICSIDDVGLLQIKGEQAREFLQGQLTCDFKTINVNRSSVGCYVNLKGRAICSFRVWQLPDETPCFVLAMHRSLLNTVREKLQKFIVFSKALISDVSDQWISVGLSGPDAGEYLQHHFPLVPGATNESYATIDASFTLVAHYPTTRFELLCSYEKATELWQSLTTKVRAIGFEGWNLQDIRSGQVKLTIDLLEQVMPAEIAFDRNGGISFTKGCYAGQEVVARLHYKGTPKQDLYHVSIEGSEQIAIGTQISTLANEEDNAGFIIQSAPASSATTEALAVLKIAIAAHAQLYVKGHTLRIISRVIPPAR